jgi:hypothetical protein
VERTPPLAKEIPIAARAQAPMMEHALQGFQYLRLLGPLFNHLRRIGRERDRAGNRRLFYDQYATLLLLYCFNPTVTSVRGLQQATTLTNVHARLGVRRPSLGALSEAAHVFDATLLHAVIGELAGRARAQGPAVDAPWLHDRTAVDTSLLPAMPRMAGAVWQDAQHRAVHGAFWIQGRDGIARRIEATAFPLEGQGRRQLGAVAIFWQVRAP